MYFELKKTFLEKCTKADLIDLFPHLDFSKSTSRNKIVQAIVKNYSHSDGLGACTPWIRICPYCRSQGYLLVPKRSKATPRFCIRCGRTSPLDALESSLHKTTQLVILASKMNRKEERATKDVLLEQALVSVITGLEVLMRETYSLIYDHRHVVMGRPIFEDIYAQMRNEFLNLGSASRWLRKVTGLNIKNELPTDDYNFLSRMYSARHIIVHNSSIKDRDFLSQTGEPDSQLNSPLRLKVPDARKLIRISRRLGRQVDQKLRDSVLAYQHDRLSLARAVEHPRKERRNSRTSQIQRTR